MISPNEVALLLNGWKEEKRRLRIILRAGWFDFSAFCFVHEANAGGANFTLDDDGFNMFGFAFEGWVFDFADPPSDDKALGVGATIESAICGASKRKDSLWIFLLEL